jgi:hypothetical protein
MSLLQRLTPRRAAPPPPDRARSIRELGKDAWTTYTNAIFLGQVDDVLGDSSLADLIRGAGSGRHAADVTGQRDERASGVWYVRQMCVDRKDEIIGLAADSLNAAWAGLLRTVAARGQRRSPMVLFHPFVLMPWLRRLVLIFALAVCASAFLRHATGSAFVGIDQSSLIVAVTLAAAAAVATIGETLDGPSMLTQFTTAVALPGSVVAFIASVSRIADRSHPQGNDLVLGVAVLGGFVAAGIVLAFEREPDTPPTTSVALPISVERAAQLIAGLAGALPLGIFLISVGRTGEGFRVFEINEPFVSVLVAGLALNAFATASAIAAHWTIPLKSSERDWAGAQAAAEAVLRDEIQSYIQELYDQQVPSYDRGFAMAQVTGLSQAFEPIWEVPTDGGSRLENAIESMPGGSIGVAGPRGIGKSTLLASFCGESSGDAALRVLVSAPVEYASREFLLHLYARVCRAAMRRGGSGSLAPDPIGTVASRWIAIGSYSLIGAIVVAGLVVLYGSATGLIVTPVQLAGVLLLLLAFGLTVQSLIRQSQTIREAKSSGRPLEAVALDRLQEIEYQQTLSGEVSGSVKLPATLETSMKRGFGLVRQPKSLPEIVDSLRDFLRLAAESLRNDGTVNGPAVFIGIDELDKIENEAKARQLLNDIKSVFGVRGCYFLVSVSEDAMASFERRGLPFRDVFDSAFDEIIAVRHLDFDASSTLIGRRTPKIPVPFKGLCFALSGGLPRDLIRATRTMASAVQKYPASGGPPPDILAPIARQLVVEDIQGKAAAVVAAIQKIDQEPATSSIIQWCGSVCAAVAASEALSESTRRLSGITLTGTKDADADFRTLRRLVREISAYAYYANTVLEFFAGTRDDQAWVEAVGGGGRPGFDALAAARRSMSQNPLVGWASVSAFRDRWGIPVIAPPTLDNVPEQAHTDQPAVVGD